MSQDPAVPRHGSSQYFVWESPQTLGELHMQQAADSADRRAMCGLCACVSPHAGLRAPGPGTPTAAQVMAVPAGPAGLTTSSLLASLAHHRTWQEQTG